MKIKIIFFALSNKFIQKRNMNKLFNLFNFLLNFLFQKALNLYN